MRTVCMHAFFAVAVTLAALPHLLADDPVAADPALTEPRVVVQLVIATCPETALAGFDFLPNPCAKMSVVNVSSDDANRLLRAVVAHKGAQILSRPQIMTINRQAARVNFGQQIPTINHQAARVDFGQTEKSAAEIVLTCTPEVKADNRVRLECEMVCRGRAESVATAFGTVPGNAETTARGTCEMASGQTMLLTAGPPAGTKGPRMVTLTFATPTVVSAPQPVVVPTAPSQQVQLDVLVLTCPNAALAGTGHEVTPRGPATFTRLTDMERSALLLAVRSHKGTKVVAEPKVVALSGRPAVFQSGGLVAVPTMTNGQSAIEQRHVGVEVQFLPIVRDTGTVYLELKPRIRSLSAARGTRTAAGFVPGFDEMSMSAAGDLEKNQTFVFVFCPDPTNSKSECTLVLTTPTVIAAPATMPAPVAATPPLADPLPQSDRLKKIASMLVVEYRSACDAGNTELAAKLARQALELDPKCFCVAPPVPVTTAVSSKLDYRSPGPPPAIPSDVRVCTDEPTDEEVLRALHGGKANRDDIEIVSEKLVDKIDGMRFYPMVGPARMHHCHWKCTVYFTESVGTTKKRRSEVVYLDKDFLQQVEEAAVETPAAPGGRKTLREKFDGVLKRVGVINGYASDPNTRMEQLIHQSKDLREIRDEWQRIWFQEPLNGLPAERK